MVDQRIAQRRRQVRRERRAARLHRTILIVVALGVAVTLLLLERSPLVAISEVRVTGVHVLSASDVAATSGLRTGTSLLRLDLDEAARRVVAMPFVESAAIVRVDPLTIEIRVNERQPAYVATRGRQHVVVDDDGVVVTRGTMDGLVGIDVGSGGLPDPGQRAASDTALGNAVAVAEGLPGPLGTRVMSLVAPAADRAVILLEDGTRVEVGRATQLDAKARALAVVLEDLAGRGVTSIDVRSPSSPVVTP